MKMSVFIFTVFTFISCRDINLGNTSELIGTNLAKSDFISVWQTTTPNESIELPLKLGANYNFHIDWGDFSSDIITDASQAEKTHTYAIAGTYTVIIRGLLEAWSFANTGSKDKILEVQDFGSMGWKDLDEAFYGCTNLTVFEGGDFSEVSTIRAMFRDASLVVPNTSQWDTSNVIDMGGVFVSALAANPDTSNWNTSKVKDMQYMFFNADSATSDVSNFDMTNVTSTNSMFAYAAIIAPDVSKWSTSNITDMRSTFFANSKNDIDLSNWDFSNNTDFTHMFRSMSLNTDSYSNILIDIEAQNSRSNLTLHADNSLYNAAGEAARDALIARGWTIIDAGRE